MKKFIIFSFFALTSLSFCISSLREKSFDVLFDHKKWPNQKERVKGLLKENKLPANIFQGQTIIGLDFSDLDLSGKDFTDCRLVKVNLKGADLIHTEFHNTHLDRCKLVGAFFRYSLDGSEKVFMVTSNDDYELVKQYSDLMEKKEEKEKAGLKEEAADLENLGLGGFRSILNPSQIKSINTTLPSPKILNNPSSFS